MINVLVILYFAVELYKGAKPTVISMINKYNDVMENESDPRTKDWLGVKSIIPMLILIFSYIIFVKKIGPKLMENRKPYELKELMILYNGLMTVFSIYLVIKLSINGWFTTYSFICQPSTTNTDPVTMTMLSLNYWYYISRFVEFGDTIFFILRKKYNQISHLHVIHHTTVPAVSWIGMKFVPEGHFTFAGYINLYVHIIMYSYYMLSAMGPEVRKYLWWKKYLTTLQLIQFIIVIAHTVNTLVSDCPVSKKFTLIITFQALLFFILFCNFYRKQYAATKPKSHKTELKKNKPIDNNIMYTHDITLAKSYKISKKLQS